MLTVYFSDGSHASGADTGQHDGKAIWFDLLDAEADEVTHASKASGFSLPSRDDMDSLRLSGRVHVDDDVLHLNIPMYVHADAPDRKSTPLGFVLGAKCLVSVRYGKSSAFDHAETQLDNGSDTVSSTDAFISIIEAISDVATEVMEKVGEEIADLSHDLFERERHRTRWLRKSLRDVGRLESRQAHTRNSTLGIARMLNFVCENELAWVDKDEQARFASLRRDLDSLDGFDEQLTNKLQFLQDALLGFINTDQNEIMKVLTVASVVTIPPIILAGIWGMNFVHMPALDWTFGYPLALTAILVSLALPLIWFKLSDWL